MHVCDARYPDIIQIGCSTLVLRDFVRHLSVARDQRHSFVPVFPSYLQPVVYTNQLHIV